ncbi:MAG: cryptochrome/photolyase family protein [bacterium]
MKDTITIFWFRRDLRWHDNHGLYKALQAAENVVPIFIFDDAILKHLPKDDARVQFIQETLDEMTNASQAHNISVYHGDPLTIYKELTSNYTVEAVYTNHDYEPYALERDEAISTYLTSQEIPFYTFKDQVIFEKEEITKKDGNPYVVYTPYMRTWKANFTKEHIIPFESDKLIDHIKSDFDYQFKSLADLGFEANSQKIAPYVVSKDIIANYEATRNFPAVKGTSRLGPHLRFGTVSVREMVAKAIKETNEIFWQELIWREFFMQILWQFPTTKDKAFKAKYDRIEWRNAPEDFKKWCEGKTGYPLVDAGMRELNETGFMHNRVRMLTGSFLCKHLLIDWRLGEAYFAEKLHDYEMASNVGNWQWVAGCGVDAAPYFRIFNPTTQIQKFDKEHKYIKKWVPEYQELTYEQPMVDHKFARERCLKVYKAALD